MSLSDQSYNHGHPKKTSRSDIRSTDIRADIGASVIGVRFSVDIRGRTDNLAGTSVILGYSSGYPHGQFNQSLISCLSVKCIKVGL